MAERYLARLLIACVLAFAATGDAVAQETGRLVRYDQVRSEGLEPRNLTIWLPPGYDASDRRYPVLYMHDGQNLFDPATAGRWGEWGVDETLVRMIGEGKARAAIVVGVWNTRQRLRDYMPAKVAARLPAPYREALAKRYEGPPLSDEYVRFLVSELKPWVDRSFRTLPDRDNTFIAGSSMGGLLSLYAATEHPEVFAGAAALSTHWPLFLTWPVEPRSEPEAAAVRAALADWLGEALPPPGRVRLYFDHGSESLDALYQPYQLAVDEVVRARGYKAGCDWTSVRFPGTAHDESVWRARADRPLGFLLGSRPSAPDCTTSGLPPS